MKCQVDNCALCNSLSTLHSVILSKDTPTATHHRCAPHISLRLSTASDGVVAKGDASSTRHEDHVSKVNKLKRWALKAKPGLVEVREGSQDERRSLDLLR
jgi:hypothetical protein